MPDIETRLKFYQLLVDQLQKYNTILWQFPATILAANVFALDKFLQHPGVLLGIAFLDMVFCYALQRLVIQQEAIIRATQAAEKALLENPDYQVFIPKFMRRKFFTSAPIALVVTHWALAIALLGFALLQITFCNK